MEGFNPLNAELNPIRHLLALVGARHIVHVSRIRVNLIHEVTDASNNSSGFFFCILYVYTVKVICLATTLRALTKMNHIHTTVSVHLVTR